MTTITYTAFDHHITLRLEGHAGYAEPGEKDVVCAAVSALTYTLINYLDDKATEGKIRNLSYRDTPGDMLVEFELVDYKEWPQVCDFLLTGYSMISEHYPENVSLKRWGTLFCGM
jgi:uncharacterized protein YsxB (DUF464 family)